MFYLRFVDFNVILWYCHVFFPCSPELVNLTTRFTDELMAQGLTKQILNLISDVSVTREFERLQKERGLGNEKHRKEVKHSIKLIIITYANKHKQTVSIK